MKRFLSFSISLFFTISFVMPGNPAPPEFWHDQVTGDPDTLSLDEVVIPGRYSPDIYSGLSRLVYTIDHETIRLKPVNSLQDILEYVTSLDIRQRGSHGVQADVSMRGGSFEQVLILLNGVRINDPQTGHHNLNIPVNKADIERIEILEGPGSRVYGPGSFSGAINIITRKPGSSGLSVSVSGGEYGYLDLHGSGDFNSGPVSHYVSLGNSSSDGFTGNTDFSKANIFYRGMADAGFGTFDLQTGYLEKGFGARNFYTALYPDQYEKIRSAFTNLSFQTSGPVNYRQSVYHRRHHDRFELFRHDPAKWYAGHNYHMTDIFGTNMILDVPHSLGNLYLGTELRREQILSSVLGDRLDAPLPVRNERDAFYNYSKKRDQINLTAGNTFIFNSFSLAAGALLSRTAANGWDLYGGLDISYNIGNNMTWFSSWNQSVREPSFTEMYYTSPVHRGNSQLKPEEAVTFETGVRLHNGNWFGHAAVFRRNGSNIIDWVRKEDELVWESKNISVLNTSGLEIEMAWRNPGLNFPVSEIRAGYAYLNISKKSEEYISAYVLDYLKHKLVTGVTIPFHRKADLVIMSVFQDRAGTYTDTATGGEIPYDPFILVDAGLSVRIIDDMIFSVDISNLFNTGYADIGNVPVPGRWIKAGLNFSFQKK